MRRLWVLGAMDPEMETIEGILKARGETFCHALIAMDERAARTVMPHEAYRNDTSVPPCDTALDEIVLVECEPGSLPPVRVRVVDHHRPGDPGYGKPPGDYWAGSSLGQVVDLLGCWDDFCDEHKAHLRMVAAADHCLGAAYKGQCPGVSPEDLMRWRAESRAAFQRRPVEDVLADIQAAQQALADAPVLQLLSVADMPHTRDHDWSRSVCEGCARDPVVVRDMRRPKPVQELPEAAMRLGVGYVSGPLIETAPDGTKRRLKYTCSGTREVIEAFYGWAERNGLVDAYGDSARGFAGAYEAISQA